LVTGATDGIGKQTAMMLAERGARVVVHGRNADRAERAARDIREKIPGAVIETLAGDFMSLVEVRGMAERFLSTHDHLDVLINNAGAFMREQHVSADGLEATFAVNYVAPFVFTHAVLPRLRESPSGRVINVSCFTHVRARFEWDNLQGERSWEDNHVYAVSKLSLVLFSMELSRRLGRGATTCNAVQPGLVSTKLLKAGFGIEGQDSLAKGAATSVYLALSEDGGRMTGRYLADGAVARTHPLAGDPLTTSRFYEWTASRLGLEVLPKPPKPRKAA
jgi:NAD(P)-dependent dehydrogenase (short-subunit alcohol dehydrogenase family)